MPVDRFRFERKRPGLYFASKFISPGSLRDPVRLPLPSCVNYADSFCITASGMSKLA
jgi:hypothetical protein